MKWLSSPCKKLSARRLLLSSLEESATVINEKITTGVSPVREGRNMSSANIVVLGNTNVDLTAYLPHEIEEGETLIAKDFKIGLGGKGANQAVAAQRGGGRVSFIGRIGTDSFGELMLEGLSKEDLDLTHVERGPGDSANATIWVQENGANRIAVFLGESANIHPEDVSIAVLAHTSAKYFISQLELGQEVVVAGLKAAKKLNLTTILNIAPYSPVDSEILRDTDWLIANEVEIVALLDSQGLDLPEDVSIDGIKDLLPTWSITLGVNLIVTLGSSGAVGVTQNSEAVFVEAPKVGAVDTVGAGDCFVGFFVAALNKGLDWDKAIQWGVMAASESVQKPGAQASYPHGKDINSPN